MSDESERLTAGGDVIPLDLTRRRARRPVGAGSHPAGSGTHAQGRERCGHVDERGEPCRNYAGVHGRCVVHAEEAAPREPAGTGPDPGTGAPRPTAGPTAALLGEDGGLAPPALDPTTAAEFEAAVERALAFLRRRLTGDYHVDEYGFDRELTEEVLLPLARPLYQRWWRVRTLGAEHVPDDTGALLVGNHAGTVPWDAIMVKVALLDDHPEGRHLRELAADLALRVPVVGPLARKSGNTLARDDDAIRLLRSGELVGVWPEGFKGVGKHYRDRYKLQRFGRGGFVEIALRAQAPIVPTAIVGSEEIYPIVANVRWLARLLGLPYFPITWQFPWLGPLGLVPLPSKWIIEFGEPIDTTAYGPEAADDPMTVLELSDRVRDTVQQMLYRTLLGRRSIFF
ncbi:acyltransferase family protein [Egibacter rhizosphaerae]|uniref:Acyltransferase family protein n=1 Tax=Egibacter rhizosphaerae TaxID=1670831 RepID=A0A411YGP9_9ACTN|nr:lysophospholipid acyltransferase family protein [Egibacter rhizosphaerae]QBI20321.1 acyltransferase family protein [Egibacter rhizosphaerae]